MSARQDARGAAQVSTSAAAPGRAIASAQVPDGISEPAQAANSGTAASATHTPPASPATRPPVTNAAAAGAAPSASTPAAPAGQAGAQDATTLTSSAPGAGAAGARSAHAHAPLASALAPGGAGSGAGTGASAPAQQGGGEAGARAQAHPQAQTSAPGSAAHAAAASASAGTSTSAGTSAASLADPLAPGAGAGGSASSAAGPAAASGVDQQQIIESVRATIELAARQGVTQARIALQPQELGELRIHLSQTSAGLLARVTADTPAAAQALAGARSELHQSLSSLGVSLLRLEIGSFASEGHEHQGRFDTTPEASSTGGPSAGDEGVEDAESAAEADAATRLPSVAGGELVDVLA